MIPPVQRSVVTTTDHLPLTTYHLPLTTYHLPPATHHFPLSADACRWNGLRFAPQPIQRRCDGQRDTGRRELLQPRVRQDQQYRDDGERGDHRGARHDERRSVAAYVTVDEAHRGQAREQI